MRSADPAFRIVIGGIDCEPKRGVTIPQARDLMRGWRALKLGRREFGLHFGIPIPMRTGPALERLRLVYPIRVGSHEQHWLLTARAWIYCDVLEQWLRGPAANDAFIRMQIAEVRAEVRSA